MEQYEEKKLPTLSMVGYNRGEIRKNCSSDVISGLTYLFDGYRLDELSISITLKTQDNIDELIKLLQVHKHCFDRNEIVL